MQAARLHVPVDGLGERNVNEMVNAMNTAITGGADGIGVCLVDKKAFNAPTDAALKAKIPVVAYNADDRRTAGSCYIGQDLFVSGQEMGKRIVEPRARRVTSRCSSRRRARRTSSRASTARGT